MTAAFTSLGSNLGAMAARGHASIPLRAKGIHAAVQRLKAAGADNRNAEMRNGNLASGNLQADSLKPYDEANTHDSFMLLWMPCQHSQIGYPLRDAKTTPARPRSLRNQLLGSSCATAPCVRRVPTSAVQTVLPGPRIQPPVAMLWQEVLRRFCSQVAALTEICIY